MNHLFLFSVGPVQGFIAQARKTQDLFAGSQLLSRLCWEGITTFQTEIGDNGHLITPHLEGNDESSSLPNRFMAQVLADKADLDNLGRSVENNVREFFKQCKEEAFEQVNDVAQQAADAQIAQHLDIHWVFVPVTDGYLNAVREVEAVMANMKQFRTFSQYAYQADDLLGEKGRKCTVDGERNVVIYRRNRSEQNREGGGRANTLPRKLQPQNGHVSVLDREEETNVAIWELAEGEGLSAVSFVKRRFLQQPHEFPSTAKVALYHFIDKVKNLNAFKKLENVLEGNEKIFAHAEEEFYFEDNLTTDKFLKAGVTPAEVDDKLELVRSLHRELKLDIKANDIAARPVNYYGLVASDGDDMGEWLQGKYLAEGKTPVTFHQALTRSLWQYSQQNLQEVHPPMGKTVYAGGEDYLGLYTIHHLFTELKGLHQRYIQCVDKEMTPWKAQDKEMTLSAGVVLAHYKEPLTQMVHLCREQEQVAKACGKDRFSITIVKHSGGRVAWVGPWSVAGVNMVVVLEKITQLLQAYFSSTFISRLIHLKETLNDSTDELSTFFRAEMKRLIARSNMTDRTSGNMELMQNIEYLIQVDKEAFTDALTICDFMARQTQNEVI